MREQIDQPLSSRNGETPGPASNSPHIVVSIDHQMLALFGSEGQCVANWPVSTGINGRGQLSGSGCTPTGWHSIRARIGGGLAPGTVFVARRPTGEIHSTELAQAYPQRDWILTRILWLSGLEPGHNRLHTVDTMRRYIYIHGTPESEPMGIPRSHGCIRMHSQDLIELFNRVPVGLAVLIV